MASISDSFILSSSPRDIYVQLSEELANEENWLDWEPETFLTVLPIENDIAKDKALAVKSVAVNTELAVTNAVAFENVVVAFNNSHVIPTVFQSTSLEELTYAVKEIKAISKIVHSVLPEFTGEVPSYVAAVAAYEGAVVLPEELSFAQNLTNFLLGVEPGSKKYKENAKLIDSVKIINAQINDISVSEESLNAFLADTPLSNMVRKLIGCRLYDPTKDA